MDVAEKWLRRAGAVGGLVFVTAAYLGLWRGLHHRKGRTAGHVPAVMQRPWYYALASAVGCGLAYLLWRPLRLTLSTPIRASALILGAPLYFSGLALMLWGRLALGEMYNVSSAFGAQLYADHRLVTTGPYALLRHPMYLGGLLAELGALLLYRTWFTMVILVVIPFLALRARREEEALAAQFGDQWAAYHRRVPAWLPRLRL